jgi:hypothetical protein
MNSRRQFLGLHLKGAVVSCPQFRDTFGLDIEAQYGLVLAELDRQRQPDIAEADKSNFSLIRQLSIPLPTFIIATS